MTADRLCQCPITHANFDRQIGVSQSYLSAVEHGRNEVGAEVLLAISQEFAKSLEWLLTGEESVLLVPALIRECGVAVEWGALDSLPKVKLLPGEKHRERVVSPEEEAKYLALTPEPLASLAAVLCDTGLRPEECFRLRWESITWTNGRQGTFLVTHGKFAAVRRVLPMTPRVRNILEMR
jgi:integrase